ncbi:unnamed protein product [Cochlearia groenlandica]
MTIFKRYLNHLIVLYVLLPLFFLRFLPYVTCQQQSESANQNSKTKMTAESVIGIILLSLFLLAIVGCCFFNAFCSEDIETGAHQPLNSRARRGLDKSVIESFPSFLYSEVKRLKIGQGGVECAICLNEFEEEETLRWMPPCSHAFHSKCIDVWLSSKSTCPVCRANLSLKPGESFPSIDIETGNAQSMAIELFQDDISLISNSVNNNENYRTPRSRSTGFLSRFSMAEIFVSRSRSAGHSLVKIGENLDQFTLQLPEEVRRQLVSLNLIRRSRMALPQARSSREGYRSRSIGGERSRLFEGRKTHRRAISLSFSFQTGSVRSPLGKDVVETSQDKGEDYGERSFERLIPEKV